VGYYHRERTRGRVLPWAGVVQAYGSDPTLNWDNLQLLGVTPKVQVALSLLPKPYTLNPSLHWDNLQLLGVTPKVQVALSLLPKPYTLNPSLHWDNLQLLGVTPKVQVALFLLLSLLLSVFLSLEWKGVGCPALR
jgi:hypothetical protein